MSDEGDDRFSKIRPYALTGGRTRPDTDLPIEAMVKSTPTGLSSLSRLANERQRIASMCASPLSVAELSAHLGLALGVVRVLVGDLVAEGMLQTHSTASSINGTRPDISTLERVLNGLQAL